MHEPNSFHNFYTINKPEHFPPFVEFYQPRKYVNSLKYNFVVRSRVIECSSFMKKSEKELTYI